LLGHEFLVGSKNVLGDLVEESDFAFESFDEFIESQTVLGDRFSGLATLLVQVGINSGPDRQSITIRKRFGLGDGSTVGPCSKGDGQLDGLFLSLFEGRREEAFPSLLSVYEWSCEERGDEIASSQTAAFFDPSVSPNTLWAFVSGI
jgi:hypothetical protein